MRCCLVCYCTHHTTCTLLYVLEASIACSQSVGRVAGLHLHPFSLLRCGSPEPAAGSAERVSTPHIPCPARVTTGEPGGPGAAEQADALYNGWLLDVPKLMDVAALYGRANGELVRRFMRQARLSQAGGSSPGGSSPGGSSTGGLAHAGNMHCCCSHSDSDLMHARMRPSFEPQGGLLQVCERSLWSAGDVCRHSKA